MSEDVVQTAHSDKIFGLAFPANYGEVFATCSAGGIRVWHLAGCRELLRISLPNLDCKCVAFAPVSAGSACMTDAASWPVLTTAAAGSEANNTIAFKPCCL
jgi:hypothetical protein